MKFKSYLNFFLTCIFFIMLLGCSRSLYLSNRRFIISDKNIDRVPENLFKPKVEQYFKKWYAESKPLSIEDLNKLDSLSRLGYEIYECLMSDSALLKGLNVVKKYEYVLVPDKIKIISTSHSNLDSCFNSSFYDESLTEDFSIKELNNFRPNISNRKCLYFKDNYRRQFYRFSAKYGVKPYVLIDSPLMHGGCRFLETSPLVNEIKIYRDTDTISIAYSIRTSDFESFFKYENDKLKFIKHRYELSID